MRSGVDEMELVYTFSYCVCALGVIPNSYMI